MFSVSAYLLANFFSTRKEARITTRIELNVPRNTLTEKFMNRLLSFGETNIVRQI